MLESTLQETAKAFTLMADDKDLIGTFNKAARVISLALSTGKPVLTCGNGGSAADAQHFVGELVGRYLKDRPAFNAICLSSNTTVLTALGNDYGYEAVFSRQVEAYAQPGAVLFGLSTSGNSANVIQALQTARSLNMVTIGLTGQTGGGMTSVTDILLRVPSTHTPLIQQLHQALYHALCDAIEEETTCLSSSVNFPSSQVA